MQVFNYKWNTICKKWDWGIVVSTLSLSSADNHTLCDFWVGEKDVFKLVVCDQSTAVHPQSARMSCRVYTLL